MVGTLKLIGKCSRDLRGPSQVYSHQQGVMYPHITGLFYCPAGDTYYRLYGSARSGGQTEGLLGGLSAAGFGGGDAGGRVIQIA